jgi:ferredoxin
VSFVPGLGIVKGMALTLRRFFEPKATIRYPEEPAALSAKFRGRLQLLYDEYGTLKCETCFQCAQACPVECIDMGGIDTKARFHVHWGAAETYGERREESALRRSGRTVPDPAYTHFEADDLRPVDDILQEHDFDPGRMLQILEATQQRYGYLPVGALKRIAHRTGAWYAMIYGTASYYRHLRFEPAESAPQAAALAARRPTEATYLAAFEASLAGSAGGRATGKAEGKAEGRAAARPGRGKTAANADGGKATRDKRDAGTAAHAERRRGRTQA